MNRLRRIGLVVLLPLVLVTLAPAVSRAVSSTTYVNSSPITVPASGAASPYPSTIAVSGLTSPVVKVTVTLFDVDHTDPRDLDILLVGPQHRLDRINRRVLLMSDVGGGDSVNNAVWTFDDGAASALPDSGQITSGVYRPTNYDRTRDSTDAFPAPAPSGTYGATLSTFDGMDPNGTWRLYVVDDASNDSGTIADGWSLTITTNQAPILNPVADKTVREGGRLSFEFAASDADGDRLEFATLLNRPDFGGVTSCSWPASGADEGVMNCALDFQPETGDAGNYEVTIRVSDGWSADTESFTMTVIDSTQPTTTATLDPSPTEYGWHNVPVTVDLSAADYQPGGSGVASITYSASGAQSIPLTTIPGDSASVVIDSAGTTTLTFHAVDNEGNVEAAQQQIVAIDATAPVTTATIPGTNAAGWNRANVTATLTASDTGGSDVQSITYSASGAQPIPSTTVLGAAATVAITTEGTTTLSYAATDGAGNVEATQTRVIRLDRTRPIMLTGPQFDFLGNRQVGTSVAVLANGWLGRDNGVVRSGLNRYQLQYSTNGGVFTNVALPSPLARQVVLGLAHGSTYRLRVRAIDNAGNVSVFMQSATESLALRQENPQAGILEYSSGWTTTSRGYALGGAVCESRTAGSSVTYTVNATHIAWIAAKAPGRGIADVYLDNVKVATVNLAQATLQGRRLVWVANDLPPGSHTVRIEVVSGLVEVDGFLSVN